MTLDQDVLAILMAVVFILFAAASTWIATADMRG